MTGFIRCQTQMTTALTSAPHRLWQNIRGRVRDVARLRFSLLLTAEGWCMAAVMLLIGLAALNTGAPLLYLLFSLMCAFFIMSAMMAGNTMRGLHVRRELPKVWQAGRPLHVALELRNSKKFSSSHGLRARDWLSSGHSLGGAFLQRIPPRLRPVRESYECVFPKRGLYRLSGVEIATRFPFGLIERSLAVDLPAEMLVLPQTIPLGKRLLERRGELGGMETHRKGSGTGLYGLREYNSEMSARDIHWRTSARRGQLMVREYEAEERRRASVILDNRMPEALQRQHLLDFEMAVVLAASAVEWFCENGFEVELRTASGIVGFGTGANHFVRCQRALACLEMVDPADIGAVPAEHSSEHKTVRVPVLMRGGIAPGSGNSFPLAVEEFRDELFSALRPQGVPAEGASRAGGAR